MNTKFIIKSQQNSNYQTIFPYKTQLIDTLPHKIPKINTIFTPRIDSNSINSQNFAKTTYPKRSPLILQPFCEFQNHEILSEAVNFQTQPQIYKINSILEKSIQKILKDGQKSSRITNLIFQEKKRSKSLQNKNFPIKIPYGPNYKKPEIKNLLTKEKQVYYRRIQIQRQLNGNSRNSVAKIRNKIHNLQPLITLSNEDYYNAELPILQQDGVAYFVAKDLKEKIGSERKIMNIRSRSLTRIRKKKPENLRKSQQNFLDSFIKGESIIHNASTNEQDEPVFTAKGTKRSVGAQGPKVYDNFIKTLQSFHPKKPTFHNRSNTSNSPASVRRLKNIKICGNQLSGSQSTLNQKNKVILLPQVTPIS